MRFWDFVKSNRESHIEMDSDKDAVVVDVPECTVGKNIEYPKLPSGLTYGVLVELHNDRGHPLSYLAINEIFTRYSAAKDNFVYNKPLDENNYIAVIRLKFKHGATEEIRSEVFSGWYEFQRALYEREYNIQYGIDLYKFYTDENGVDTKAEQRMIAMCPKADAEKWINKTAPKFQGGRYEANGTIYRESDIVSYTYEIITLEQ